MVSKDEIKHLGWLSRLELTEEEIVRYTFQIKEVIKYLNKLDSISLSEVEPIHLKKKISELRNDDVKPFEGNALEGAKNKKDGFIKGPRMV